MTSQKGIIRNIRVERNKLTCDIHSDVGIVNAIRRSLINNVSMCAPSNITFDINTSCMPDEFLAHRIGLIPFHKSCTTTYSTATIDVENRTVYSEDIINAKTAHSSIPIITLINGQRLKCTIHFEEDIGFNHARFSAISACAFKKKNENVYELSYEVINNDDPISIFYKAIDSLTERIKKVETMLSTMD